MSDIETTKTVVAIQGISVEPGIPQDGYVLTYVATAEEWQPQPISQLNVSGINEFTATGTITNFASTQDILGLNTNVPIKEFIGETVPDGSTQALLASYQPPFGVQSWKVSVLGANVNDLSSIFKSDRILSSSEVFTVQSYLGARYAIVIGS